MGLLSRSRTLAGDRVVQILAVCALATLAVFVLAFYATGFGVYSDGIGYYAQLRSLVFDGNLDVSNEYQVFSETTSLVSGQPRWPHPIPRSSKYTVGLGLVLSPAFLAGHGLAVLLNQLGMPVAADGYSWPYEALYCLASVLLGIWGMALAYRGAAVAYGRFSAATACVGIWFASPIFYYLAVTPSMSHAVSQFLISAFLYIIFTGNWQSEKKLQIGLGAILGLATLVRPANALFAVVPAFLLVLGWKKDGRVRWRDGVALAMIGGIALLLLVPQLLVYGSQFGSLASVPYVTEGATIQTTTSFNWLRPKMGAVLFSSFHGLFTWQPITLLSILGLLISIPRDRNRSLSLLVVFFLQLYVVSAWHSWWQGASLGGRMFSNCSYIFVLGLASLWHRFQRTALGRTLVVALTVGLVLWNALLVLQFISGMIPGEAPVPLAVLADNQRQVLAFFFERLIARLFL